jgi:hypothetical protein
MNQRRHPRGMAEQDLGDDSPTTEGKYCARCGTGLEVQMLFCDQCGASHSGLCDPDGNCHWCGHQNAAAVEVCERCGARLITICPRCQARVKAGQNYCGYCGLDYGGLIQTEEE